MPSPASGSAKCLPEALPLCTVSICEHPACTGVGKECTEIGTSEKQEEYKQKQFMCLEEFKQKQFLCLPILVMLN